MSLTKATYSMIDGATANVLDFGANGNGSFDCTTAFQAAIDFCLDNSKTLFVPQGNYLITDPLLINGTRASGSQVTFRMVGEIASDAITQGDGVIESRTNIIFNKTASKLFDIQFNDFYFQNVSFEDFSIRQTKDSVYFRTSEGFSVGKSTANYVQKLLWQNVNCYGMKNFIRFYCTTGDPSTPANYFGPTYIDRCNAFKTETCVELDNVNMNLFYLDRNMFHDTTVGGGIHINGSATFMNMRNTHFEGCEPAGIYQTDSNWNCNIGLDNVSAENTGVDSGYGLLQPYMPAFGYSGLKLFVSNRLYPSAFMPDEIRLPFGAEISSQCPIKASGYGWIAVTPETVTPVVSNDATYGQTDTYTMFLSPLSTDIGRHGNRFIETSLAGSNAGVGRTPYSGTLPTGVRERCVGINTNNLINNNTESSQTVADGYVYGSFAAACTDANNGFANAVVTIGGVDIDVTEGFTWGPYTGLFTIVAPIETGDFLTTCDVTIYQSEWRTPIYWSFEPKLLTAAEAAVAYPKSNRYDNSVNTASTFISQEFGQLNEDYTVRVRHIFNAGAKGVHEYIVRGDGTTAGRVYVVAVNSLGSGVAVTINGSPSNENLYKIDIANTTGSILYITREVEYIS